METPYIDIHTHRHRTEPDEIRIFSLRMGNGVALPEGFFSAGIHPWDAEKTDAEALTDFPVGNPFLKAVGETGLDFAARNVDPQKQLVLFCKQLDLTERLDLPVIIHCVKAWEEVLSEVKHRNLKATVIHGFTGSRQLATELTRHGFYLSFGMRTFVSPKTMEALQETAPERIFLETDEAPETIREVYERAAEVLGKEETELKERLFTNYKKVFG